MVDKIGIYRTKKQDLYLNKVASMHESGIDITEIAETLNLSRTTVYVWLNAIASGNPGEVKVTKSSTKSKEKASSKQEKPAKSKRATRRIVQKVVNQLREDGDIDYSAAVKPKEANKPEGNASDETNKTTTNKEDEQSSLLRKLAAENKRLKKKLIEETIKSAALESTLEEERSQKSDDLAGKSPQELTKLNKELRKQLKHEHMRAEAYDTMIDIAEDMFDLDIRKKPGAK